MTMRTPMSEFTRELQKEAARVRRLTIRAFSMLGEKCVTKARDRSGEESWFDQSGNLRSSIGYVIAYQGEIIHYSAFSQVKQGTDGTKVGKELAEELVKEFTNDYVLIVVAGMNYAEKVEDMENKDVLASTELWVNEELPKMLDKLRKQIAK